MSGAPADILLRNLLARMRADVDTLLALHHLSPADAAAILGKLPPPPGELGLPAPQRGPPPPPRTPRPGVNARALWAYNERREGADLSFAVGDTVEVLDRTNAEWWTGRAHGREGLFPANHVELIEARSPPQPPQPARGPMSPNGPPRGPPFPQGPYGGPPPPMQGGPPPMQGGPPPPMGMGMGMGGYQSGPPPPPGYGPMYAPGPPPPAPYGAPMYAPVPPPPQPAPAPAPAQQPSKLGDLGNTMAHAAAGGAGWTLGADVVNRIF